MEELVGRIHSIETFGAVDGPGLRLVIFMQGCRLRCIYCHNPDSWQLNGGLVFTAADLFEKTKEYAPYIKNGGVTLSGGEPLLQVDFVREFFKLCKENGFHTACDTAGSVELYEIKKAICYVDLFLLDIKALNYSDCFEICGCSSKNSISLLKYCQKIGKKVWIRHVLLPGYSLNFKKLAQLADFIANFSCVEKVELLPFHKMGEFKWKELGLPYRLTYVSPPTKADLQQAVEIFRQRGLKVI